MPAGCLEDVSTPLVFIEGPVKVDACWQAIPSGFCFIGLTGTHNIKDRRGDDGIWKADNDTKVLPELKAIPMRGRRVIVLFDSDIDDNISVDAAAKEIGNWTRSRGARPFRCTLPSESDGSKNGADDFLVRYGAGELLERLEAAEPEGWPLPAPLLTHDGELKRSYTCQEEARLLNAMAAIHDPFQRDKLARSLHRRLGLSRDELLLRVADISDGVTERGLFGDPDELDTPGIDSRWIVPGILPMGECIFVTGLAGTSKTFFAYALGSACRRGGEFLGMTMPKLRVCILQLEEAGSFAERMRMFGFDKSEIGQTWNFVRDFNPLKPTHLQLFREQVLPHYDLILLDSLREMSAGSGLNENQAEFSQRLVRPLAKAVRGTKTSLVLLDHNAKGTNAQAGGDDKRAAVWGVFNFKKISERSDNQISMSSIQAHGGKARDSEAIFWELRWDAVESPAPGEDRIQWVVVSDLRPDCLDLSLLTRTLAHLEGQSVPLTLRDIGQRLGLPNDADGKVHGPLRKLASRSPALRRYRDDSTTPATYFIPLDGRKPLFREPASNANGFQGSAG